MIPFILVAISFIFNVITIVVAQRVINEQKEIIYDKNMIIRTKDHHIAFLVEKLNKTGWPE